MTKVSGAQVVLKEAEAGANSASRRLAGLKLELQSVEKDLEAGANVNLVSESEKGQILDGSPMDVDVNAVEVMPEVPDRLRAILDSSSDDPQGMRHLVMLIIPENKERAAQAQCDAMSVNVPNAMIKQESELLGVA